MLIVQLNFQQEVVRHILKRILWPREEPINQRVTNQAREVTTSNSQSITSWGHTHEDMQVFSTSIHEVLPSEFFSFGQFLCTNFFIKRTAETVFFFFGEETRHHTDSQDVVDQFEEAGLDNVCVCEQESFGFVDDFFVEVLEIDSEVNFFVATNKVDSVGSVASDESSQTSEGLFTRATETN